ncbi:MAG: transposase, partial [Deltaproteobacteria bacterium]|nr:transposase [Deltaproteobacteria bacterium]
MIYTKDHKTGYLFDPWKHLGPKRRRLMEQSWAGLFREHILSALPVHTLASFFTEGFGRPTKELYMVLGVLLLQQMHDLSDEETIYQLAFNEQWHYALDITDASDDAAYLSPKTLWNMRTIVTDNKLDTLLFHRITDILVRAFSVDTSKQRIDSVHIRSNMRRLGRIGIFATTIHTFLVNLRRQHKAMYEQLDPALRDRYITTHALSCFSLVKPSESRKTLAMVSGDLFTLVHAFKESGAVTAMHSYKLMQRVLKEQCAVT